jgi:uncharacterized phage protein gp47/JayE
MATFINDINKSMTDYIKNTIKATNPDVDTSVNSAVYDLIVRSMSAVFAPVINQLSDLEFSMNLDNAAYMSEDDLDEKIEGNYGIIRNAGRKATGSVTFKFRYDPTLSSVVIPQGASVSTTDGLLFLTVDRTEIGSLALPLYYNPETFMYEITVNVEAANVGEAYNVGAGQIKKIDSVFSQYLSSVSNYSDMEGGTDRESNTEYAARARSQALAPHIGTRDGYRNAVRSNFPEAKEILVVGHGHPLMTRDLYTVLVGGTPQEIHIGGKTDIYIRGHNTASVTQTLVAKSNIIKLKNPNVEGTSVIVSNGGSPLSEFVVEEDNDGYSWVTIPKMDGASTQWDYGDTIAIQYNDDSSGAYEESYEIEALSFKPLSPFIHIVSIANVTQNTVYDLSEPGLFSVDYAGGFEGTNLEDCTVSLFYPESLGIRSGDEISVIYRYNKTVRDVSEYFISEGRRIITTDILVSNAIEKFIHIEMDIKLRPGTSPGSEKISAVRTVISDMFSGMRMGESITESRLVSALMTDPSTASFIGYIKSPFKTFHGTSDDNEAFTSEVVDGDEIELNETEFPTLKYCIVNYI